MVFVIYHLYIALQARSPVCALKRAHMRAISLRCVKVSQFESFLRCANFAAMFCTRSRAFTCPCGLVVKVPGYISRGPGFDSRRYQIFWEVAGLERGPLSLVSTSKQLLGRNSSGSGLENRECGRGDPLRWPRDTLYPQKMALTSPACGDRSVGIVRLRTKTTEFL
jgi:hypothetical protein